VVTVPAPLGVLTHDPASEPRYSPLTEPKQYPAIDVSPPVCKAPVPKALKQNRPLCAPCNGWPIRCPATPGNGTAPLGK
jgi:hypothetical protein